MLLSHGTSTVDLDCREPTLDVNLTNDRARSLVFVLGLWNRQAKSNDRRLPPGISRMLENSKTIDLAMIEASPEIQEWLSQFSETNQNTAISLLMRLHFVSRDRYSDWLKSTLRMMPSDRRYGVYAIRKLVDVEAVFFDPNGRVVSRPPGSLGSEDFVYSLISSLTRQYDYFLDHPALHQLKEYKIHEYVIIDDSIGSGKRVSGFVSSMFKNKTFLSWWSSGLVNLHVVAMARMREAEKYIIDRAPGSDHPKRKHPKSSKFNFISELVYSKDWIARRWGRQYEAIVALCDGQTEIPPDFRKGFGSVMGNLIFYHSVPNNIPGCLFHRNRDWRPLFPGRALPDWTQALLEGIPSIRSEKVSTKRPTRANLGLSIELLSLIKRGVRNKTSLALRLDLDSRLINELLVGLQSAGLLSSTCRITKAGADFLAAKRAPKLEREYDHSLYIPGSWCTDRPTTQPSASGADEFPETTDPASDFVGGWGSRTDFSGKN